MSTAALNSATRNALHALVDREERRLGSRSVAYEVVAQSVGLSASWVSKFLRDTGEVKEPRITVFQNIRAAYDQLCERVEADNRADERKLRILRGEINAIDQGMGATAAPEDSTVVE